jgi:hypothetical protein
VIKSINYDFYYKGHCENLEIRLQQHNSGSTQYIKILFYLNWHISRYLTQEMKRLPEKNTLKLQPEEDF